MRRTITTNPTGRPRPRTKEDRTVSTRTRTTRRGKVLSLALAALVAASTLAVGGVPGGSPAASAGVSPPAAANHDFGQPIFSADARGDITTIGNITTKCNPARQQWRTPGQGTGHAQACLDSVVGAETITGPGPDFLTNPPPRNNDFEMIPVDVDTDATTASSSMASIDMPAGSTVLYAGLHWNATYRVDGFNNAVSAGEYAARNEMRLKVPGGSYQTIPADDTWEIPTGTRTYAAYADVTSLVAAAGEGDYWGADVIACTGFGGCFGSWTMTVAYANPNEPARNLNVWHGWQNTHVGGEQVNTVTGITPPPSGPVTARIGVVNADGDRGYGDSFDISSPSHPTWTTFGSADRPFSASDGNDWFNSTTNYFGARRTNAQAIPNEVLNMNQDIALVEDSTTIDNSDNSFSFRTKSEAGSGEQIYNQVIHSAVLIYQPEIAVDKTVSPASGLATGDEVTWTVKVDNAGIDTIRNSVVTDPLPAGVTYVPGSVEYVSGGPSDLLGAKTDGTGDDEADYDAGTRELTFRVGAGADATNGGTMGVAPADDGSDTITITYKTTLDVAPGEGVTNTAYARGEGRELEDPYGPIETTDEDPAAVAVDPLADLKLVKSTEETSFIPGETYTYGINVTNAGDGIARNAVVTDTLRDGLEFVSASNGGTASGQTVTWNLGDIAPGQSVDLTLDVRVARPAPASLIDEDGVIPNTAKVTADNTCLPDSTDPDCTSTVENPPAEPHLTQDKVVDKAKALPGDELTYTVTVGNDGDAKATKVLVDDKLPEGATFVSADPAKGTIVDNGNGTLTWTIGDLAVDEVTTAQVIVKIDKGQWDAELENRIKATNDPEDCIGSECKPPTVENPCTDDATWSCAPTKTPAPGLRQDKVVDKAEAKPGDVLTYTVTVANTGEVAYKDLPAVDELPNEVTFVSASDGGVHKDGKVTWTIASLKPGEKVSYTVKAKVNAGVVNASFVNRFKVTPPDDFPPAQVDHKCSDDAAKSCAPTKTPGDSSGGGGGGTRLPLTGANSVALVALGASLIGGGLVLMRLRRRSVA
jgi:uncharacterized repeat protein (TIGR01451 family)/LPXTG-motif cell wall-anchored protein